MSFLFGVIAASYDTTVPPTPPPPPPPPTCTPTCGAWSVTVGEWSEYSTCVNNTQTRTRTVSGTRTCTASDCSTYTETSSDPTVLGVEASQSQACSSPPPTTTWYCTTFNGGTYTSTSDVSESCVVSCSTSGYPGNVPC
jgi:hypothetical protein